MVHTELPRKSSLAATFFPPPAFGSEAQQDASPRTHSTSGASEPPSPVTFGLDGGTLSSDSAYVLELWQDFDGVSEQRLLPAEKRRRAAEAGDTYVRTPDGDDVDDGDTDDEDYKPKPRGKYRCRLCGQAKRRHACPFSPPGRSVRAAATQTDKTYTGFALHTRTKALAYAVGRMVSVRKRASVVVPV